MESVKICPKTHGIQHSRQHQSRRVPLEVSGVGGGPLPHAASDNVGQGEMQSVAGGQMCVRGSFCEVAEKEGGAVVHALLYLRVVGVTSIE